MFFGCTDLLEKSLMVDPRSSLDAIYTSYVCQLGTKENDPT